MVVSNDWSKGTTRSRNFGVRVSDDTAAKNPWSPRSPGSTPHRPPPLPLVPFRAGSLLLPMIPAPVDTTPLPWDTNRDESTINLGLWHISWNTKLVTWLTLYTYVHSYYTHKSISRYLFINVFTISNIFTIHSCRS